MSWKVTTASFALMVAVLLIFPPLLQENLVLGIGASKPLSIRPVRDLVWTPVWDVRGHDRLSLKALTVSILGAAFLASGLGTWGNRRRVSLPAALIAGVVMLGVAAGNVPTNRFVVDNNGPIKIAPGLRERKELVFVPIWHTEETGAAKWNYFFAGCESIVVLSLAIGLLCGTARHDKPEKNTMPGEAPGGSG